MFPDPALDAPRAGRRRPPDGSRASASARSAPFPSRAVPAVGLLPAAGLLPATILAAGAVLSALPCAAQAPEDWQQEVHYTIEARLDEGAQVLRGAATLGYRNASPDTLDRLYFHLSLNAFRPASLWARTEQRERFDFASLEDPEYGYERLREARLVDGPGASRGAAGEAGLGLTPVYPGAPDSTVVYFDLPAPLPPGDSLALRLAWDARPSTLCRRQCRRGRDWDLAQWYPRIAVYDAGGWQPRALQPQGEFYGEFGTYDVTLDLAEDQVVGATGIPLSGDPGWNPGPASPVERPDLGRDWYESPREARSPGYLPEGTDPGRKRVRFYAERVHHFAWSTSPDYRYEGAIHETADGSRVRIHVLFRPGDVDWDLGAAARRTVRALEWLETVFGPYPYPQLTNLHRLEGGGTEFPMVIMDGGPSQGLIVHEGTHQYAHGILANNEWKEAWLDEGLTSFLTSWFMEEHGAPDPWSRALEGVAGLHRQGEPLPVATRSEEFPDYGAYGAMSYTKASVVFYMLRELVGEATMRSLLREYYRRYRFRHVDEAALRRVAEDATGRDLDWFFDQWLHSSDVLDYGIEDVSVQPEPGGGTRTTVTVVRSGNAWMPVTLRVGDVTRRLESRQRRQVVEVVTDAPPGVVELDPGHRILDLHPENDRRELGGGS